MNKTKNKFEKDIFRVIINANPKRSPDGQLKEIMKLIESVNASKSEDMKHRKVK